MDCRHGLAAAAAARQEGGRLRLRDDPRRHLGARPQDIPDCYLEGVALARAPHTPSCSQMGVSILFHPATYQAGRPPARAVL
jgi:hypothetical protein